MKKHYSLAIAMVCGLLLNAQHFNKGILLPDENIETSTDFQLEKNFHSKIAFQPKAFGDTLFYTDFAGGLPAGWTIVNNNANNFQWNWDTVYQQGQFSGTRNTIKSTTASNGFMVLPSDFYNTPTPTSGRVSMDTYFQSDTITIIPKPSVWVSYQQYVRFCCSSSNKHVLQVSTDNFVTFTEFDAINGLAVNAGNTSDAVGGRTNIINISSVVANQSQFQIRFLAENSGRYFWMIDDLAIIEGVENDLELSSPYMEFNEANYTYYPFYGEIPSRFFPPLPFFGRIYNNGSNTQTNVRLEVDVYHDQYPNGTPGTGLVYTSSMNTNPSTVVSGSIVDSTIPVLTGNPRFVPAAIGDYRVQFLATSDSVDGNIGNETAVANFTVNDTTYARDDNGFGGGTGPASYVRNGQTGGTATGDRFAIMYIIEAQNPTIPTISIPKSISFFVSNDIRNIGAEIVPKIWEFDEDSLFINGTNFSVDRAFGAEIASSFIPYTVTSADTNSFITLPLDNGSAIINGLDSGQYAVGWESTSIANNTTFEVANDATSAALQAPVTAFNYHGHSPSWGWVSVNPVIRLNFHPTPVGIDKNSSTIEFDVLPNPNNGWFKMIAHSTKKVNYLLEIRNNIGQLIQEENMVISGSISKEINLTHLDKGVYYISLRNDSEKITKKVIVQ